MLQNRLRLVLLDRLGHHVQDVVHHRGTQLQVVVRFDTLLRDSLGDTLAVSTFELTREKIAKPSFEKRDNSTHEEQPDTPTGSPEPTTWAFTDRAGVETIIDQVLEVLRHAYLPHELVLVAVHARQSTNVREYILQGVR